MTVKLLTHPDANTRHFAQVMLQEDDDTDNYTDQQMLVVKAAAETKLKLAKASAETRAKANFGKRNASVPPYTPGKQIRNWDNNANKRQQTNFAP